MDGMLSQEEINALLSGMSSGEQAVENSDSLNEELSLEEKDAVGEIANINMGTAATTLYTLVSKKVTITTPVVSYATWGDVVEEKNKPCVFIQIYYKHGLDGNNILVLKEEDVKVITDLMMGGDGTNIEGELGELHLSAISEAMNQMMGSAATSLSSMLNTMIDISPPTARRVNLNDNIDGGDISPFLSGRFVKIAFKMEIEGLVDSQIMQLYPFDFARELYKNFASSMKDDMNQVPEADESFMGQTPNRQVSLESEMGSMGMQMQDIGVQQQMQGMGMPNMQQQMQGMGMQNMQMPNMQQMQNMHQMQNMQQMQNVNVQPAHFQTFSNTVNYTSQHENIGLIMDVPLEVTVELGRTQKSIQDILDFAPGTIIELNKIAGEPIDVLVNGKHVAKGEVVVIEESFGIRVTEIIK